jgi:TolB-like protein
MKRLFAVMMLLMGTTAYAAAPARVLLLPFESVGDSAKPWIAKAVQQNLVAELSRVSSVTPITGEATAADLNAAVRLGENAKADYVVFGTYQAVEGDLRMTGQVVDVSKKDVVAGLKATGTQRDLFGMEDVIANQVKRALPQPVAQAPSDMLKQPVPPEPEAAPEVAANTRARELEQQLDRAIERLKNTPPYYGGEDYYPPTYGYSGFYQPYVYYTTPYYYYPRHHGHGHHYRNHAGGTWLNGRLQGATPRGNVRVGGGVGYGVPRGSNYVNFGRMSR